jgi:hypothetical protein
MAEKASLVKHPLTTMMMIMKTFSKKILTTVKWRRFRRKRYLASLRAAELSHADSSSKDDQAKLFRRGFTKMAPVTNG